MLVQARKKWSNGPWWSKLIQGISPFEFWKKNLFLTRNQFFDLTKELQPYISPILLSPNHRALNTDKKLALTLYYLKDTGSLIMTAHNFGVAINTVSSVIYEVYLVICQNLGNQIKCSFGRLNARWAILTRNMNLKLEILPTIFMLTLFCTITVKKNKFYIDEEVVKSQIEIFKKNEESYKNVSDFIFHLIVVRTQ